MYVSRTDFFVQHYNIALKIVVKSRPRNIAFILTRKSNQSSRPLLQPERVQPEMKHTAGKRVYSVSVYIT